jgi:hypothetical protein
MLYDGHLFTSDKQVKGTVHALHNKPKAEVHLGPKLTGPKEEEEQCMHGLSANQKYFL